MTRTLKREMRFYSNNYLQKIRNPIHMYLFYRKKTFIFKVYIKRTGGNTGLFGYRLHGDTRQAGGFYQAQGSLVNFIDLILVSGFHDANLNE